MASNYFNISPTTGTGNGNISVAPSLLNNTTEDREAVVVITNGGKSVSATVIQFGMPSITGQNFPISAPATGSAYTFTVHTHYPVQFRNKPDWVTIDDGQGNYISSATTIQPNVANGKTYNLTVAPNASTDDRTATFGMYHYVNGTLIQTSVPMNITQPKGAEDFITIPSTIAIDWDDNNNAKGITVTASTNQWRAEIDNTTDFTLYGGQGTISIKANNVNSGTTRKTTTLSVISTKASFPYTATCQVIQYRQPVITKYDPTDVPATGGSKTVYVTSDYDWWIHPTVNPESPSANIPYITMTDKVIGQNMSPATASTPYELVWDAYEYGAALYRTDQLKVGYIKTDNSTTGLSSSYAEFSQPEMVADDLTLSQYRIPSGSTGSIPSTGGSYQIQVICGREWYAESNFWTVNPSSGTGTTNVTITVPPATAMSQSGYTIYTGQFATVDPPVASKGFVVALENNHPYIVCDPDDFDLGSGTSLNNQFVVSANTDWVASIGEYDWIDMSTTTGHSGTTTVSFDVAANDQYSARTAEITVSGMGLTRVVSIVQARKPEPVIVDSITLSSYGGNVSSGGNVIQYIDVTASDDWTLTTRVSWMRWRAGLFDQTPVTGGTSGTTQIYRTVDANSGSSRTGTTVFTCGIMSANYTVTQDAAYVPPVYDDIVIEPEDDISNIPLTGSPSTGFSINIENDGSNAEDWTIDYSADDVHLYTNPSMVQQVDMIEAGTIGYFSLHIPAVQTPRTIVITFTGEESSRTHTLTIQQG